MNLFGTVVEASKASTDVSLRSFEHGPRHWRDVARIAHMIWAEDRAEVDPILLFLFALFHDSQRVNEYHDPDHGERAWISLKIIVPDVDPRMQAILGNHDRGITSTDPLSGICWDADRLTLPRVGIVPQISYFSTACVKHSFEHFILRTLEIMYGNDVMWDEITEAYSRGEPLDRRKATG